MDGQVKPGHDEAACLKAYVLDLPGCVSVGDTPEQVKSENREAIEFHLEGMREDGLPILKLPRRAEQVEVGEQAA